MQVVDPRLSKEVVIAQLMRLLVRQNRIDDSHAQTIIQQLLQRERFGSSAIGKELAIPHARIRDLGEFVGAVGIAIGGMEFDSMDRKPTKLIFLTLAPFDDRDRHVQLLSRLANLTKDKRLAMHLLHAINTDDLYELLADIDGESAASETLTSQSVSKKP